MEAEKCGSNVSDAGATVTQPEQALHQEVAGKGTQDQDQQTGASTCRKKVLIAIDSSKFSERALHWYAAKLHAPGDQILFVNVAEPPELALGFGMAGPAVAEIYTKAMDETIAQAQRLASSVKEACRSLGIEEKVRFLERIGHSPGQAIVDVADEEQVDLIVMGSRGVGVIRRTFLGSVSDYVLHHSRRAAVTVVPAHMPCLRCRQLDCSADRACPNTCRAQQGAQLPVAEHADCKME